MYLSSPTSEDGRNKSSAGILRDSLKGVSREGQWIKVSCASQIMAGWKRVARIVTVAVPEGGDGAALKEEKGKGVIENRERERSRLRQTTINSYDIVLRVIERSFIRGTLTIENVPRITRGGTKGRRWIKGGGMEGLGPENREGARGRWVHYIRVRLDLLHHQGSSSC